MKKTPEISLIMSVYNGEEYLAETLESVLAQTFGPWELIVINDCSTDSTAEILAQYASRDERVKVYPNEVNLRLPTSLNRAIDLSSGKYVARMDADDICTPDRLEKQYKFMEENPDVALSSCRFMTLKNGVYSSGGCGNRCDFEALRAMLLVTNPILHPGVIARREVIGKFKYDPTHTCTEDLELWTRLAKAGVKMEILPEYLLIYRLHDKQITSTTLEKQHREVLKVQDTYLAHLLGEMSEDQKKFYISGIYFKESADIKKFTELFMWAKAKNREKKLVSQEALSYAFFEMLAEYKRCGISKKEVLSAMLKFSPIFLIKEFSRRKRAASREGKRCIASAERMSLYQNGGTKVFPVFEKRG